MKLSWLVLMILPSLIGLLNFQNPHATIIHFLTWKISLSTALVLEITALLGVVVGLALGAANWRNTTEVFPRKSSKEEAPLRPGQVTW